MAVYLIKLRYEFFNTFHFQFESPQYIPSFSIKFLNSSVFLTRLSSHNSTLLFFSNFSRSYINTLFLLFPLSVISQTKISNSFFKFGIVKNQYFYSKKMYEVLKSSVKLLLFIYFFLQVD